MHKVMVISFGSKLFTHADHYLRSIELNDKKANFSEKNKISDDSLTKLENKNRMILINPLINRNQLSKFS